jgi:hypothetical protein
MFVFSECNTSLKKHYDWKYQEENIWDLADADLVDADSDVADSVAADLMAVADLTADAGNNKKSF